MLISHYKYHYLKNCFTTHLMNLPCTACVCLLFYTAKVIERSRLFYIDMIVVWMCSEVYWHWLWFFDEFRQNNFRYKVISRVHNLASKTCFKTIKGYIASYCKKRRKTATTKGRIISAVLQISIFSNKDACEGESNKKILHT